MSDLRVLTAKAEAKECWWNTAWSEPRFGAGQASSPGHAWSADGLDYYACVYAASRQPCVWVSVTDPNQKTRSDPSGKSIVCQAAFTAEEFRAWAADLPDAIAWIGHEIRPAASFAERNQRSLGTVVSPTEFDAMRSAGIEDQSR